MKEGLATSLTPGWWGAGPEVESGRAGSAPYQLQHLGVSSAPCMGNTVEPVLVIQVWMSRPEGLRAEEPALSLAAECIG